MFVVEVKTINPFSFPRNESSWVPVAPAERTHKEAEIVLSEYRKNQPDYANRMRIREV